MTLKHLSAKAETRATPQQILSNSCISKRHFLLVGFLLKTLQTVDIFVTFVKGVVLSLLNNLP